MKLLSFLKSGIITNLNRFPVVTSVVFLAVALGLSFVYQANLYDTENDLVMEKLILAMTLCNLSVLLGLAFDLFVEYNPKYERYKWPLRILSVALSVFLFFFLNLDLRTHVVKLVVLCVSAHFLVSSLPFLKDKGWGRFWLFNAILFQRIILSAFYSGVIFLGLALALLAQKELLNIYEGSDLYGYIAVIVFIGFNTLFFISGIPYLKDAEKETVEDYPFGLRVFAGYVILPLVAIYLGILLLFEVKILLTGDMPEGFVSWMIFCFAVAGILGFLLLYPILGFKENKWMRIALTVFSYSLFPLLFLLWLAIYIRMKDYGWTELRYIHVSLSLWLTFFVLYFMIKRDKVRIKWLPLSIATIGFFMSFGPWGYSYISEKTQKGYIDHFVQNPQDTLIGAQIYDKLDYLIEYHGYSAVEEYVSEEGKKIIEDRIELNENNYERNHWEIFSDVQNNLAFSVPEQHSRYTTAVEYAQYDINISGAISTEGYKHVIIPNSQYQNDTYEIKSLDLKLHKTNNYINVTYKGHEETVVLGDLVKANKSFFEKYRNKDYNATEPFNAEEMKPLQRELFDGQIKLIITQLSFNKDADSTYNFWNINTTILLK